jgi:hypothetical protein
MTAGCVEEEFVYGLFPALISVLNHFGSLVMCSQDSMQKTVKESREGTSTNSFTLVFASVVTAHGEVLVDGNQWKLRFADSLTTFSFALLGEGRHIRQQRLECLRTES